MVGSVLDHAIGLTCYLLSLNVETWLLLGFGIPHGSTAYVLMREYIKEVAAPVHYIFDVLSGTKYSLLDIYCPLQRIFCVINEHNVNSGCYLYACSWISKFSYRYGQIFKGRIE